MVGWVYAFVTPSMPGIAKFGATERDPTERLREANACTWHLHEYAIAAAQEVDDPFAVERAIHAMLASRRVHPRREFFRVTCDEASALLALVVPAVSGDACDAPIALVADGGEADADGREFDEDADGNDAAGAEGGGGDEEPGDVHDPGYFYARMLGLSTRRLKSQRAE